MRTAPQLGTMVSSPNPFFDKNGSGPKVRAAATSAAAFVGLEETRRETIPQYDLFG